MQYLPNQGWKRALIFCFYAILTCFAGWIFFHFFAAALLPFLIAWAVASMLHPLATRAARKARLPVRLLCGLLVLLSTLSILGILILLCGRLWQETRGLITWVSENLDDILAKGTDFWNRMIAKIPGVDHQEGTATAELFRRMVTETLTKISSRLPEIAASLIRGLPGALFFTVVLIMAGYYASTDYSRIRTFLLAQLPPKAGKIFRRIQESLGSTGLHYLRAYLLILVITFTELLIGFLILRVEYAFSAAAIIAIADLLPVIGVGTILIPWSLVAMLTGQIGRGVGLFILFAVLALVRQVIEPRLIGLSLGLHPLATLIAMYTGFRLLGIGGTLLFPAILIVCKNLVDADVLQLWKKPAGKETPDHAQSPKT